MTKVFQMSVYDLGGKKLCSLYDSRVAQDGAAYEIKIKKEIGGWKEISFSLSKYNQSGEHNFRCDYIRNEYHLRVVEDDEIDVYCIKTPEALHDKSKLQYTVLCNHISEELKTKNIFKYFDDTNGIGTCEELISKALKGSGWKLIQCDKFLESDGITEKIRSYSCEAKTGAQNMISEICKLFDARPVFHGINRTVEIHASSNTQGWMEILFGKNLSKIKRKSESDKIVTRLYVEGEYGDYGYVGIDDVNPTGLPFILNFDYFKEIGVFTDAHQQIADKQVVDYKKSSDDIKAATSEYLSKYARLSELVGNLGQIYYPVVNAEIAKDNLIVSESMPEEKLSLNVGDKIYVVNTNGSQQVVEYSGDLSMSNVLCIIKFLPAITGLLAAYEDTIKASQRAIDNQLEKINHHLKKEEGQELTVEALKTLYGTNDLSTIKDEGFDYSGIAEEYKKDNILEYAKCIGDEEKSIAETQIELYSGMLEATEHIQAIDQINQSIEASTLIQENVEDEFVGAMGSMLRDGYWSDTNYTVGQEQSLYNDADAISKKLAYPTISYTLETHNLSFLDKYKGEDFQLAQTVRIQDPVIKINDHGIVAETITCPDKPTSNSIAVKTDLLDVGTKSFATILERVTTLAEQVRRNKDKYERAAIISSNGTLHSDMLEGAIDVMKTQLISNASNWRTDEKGNIIFVTLDGRCAMMLCGSGFMIANSKLDNGDWNWRTFGTGNGFAADLITTGYLDAARIDTDQLLAKEGFVDKITTSVIESSDFASKIDLANQKIDMIVSSETTESQLVLTDFMMSLITTEIEIAANKIDFSANESLQILIGNEVNKNISSVQMTQEKFETFVENSKSISKISQKANGIDIVIQGDSTSTEVRYTDAAIEAMSENINLRVNEEFNLTVGDLETKILANQDGIEATAGEVRFIINKTANDVQKWFTFTDDKGLIIQKPEYTDDEGNVHKGSIQYTVTDENGYHIWEKDVAEPVGSFRSGGLKTTGVSIGDIACKRTSTGGWVWTDAVQGGE